MNNHSNSYPIRLLCTVMNVSRRAFYECPGKPPPAGHPAMSALQQTAARLFSEHKQTPGSRRLKHEAGFHAGRFRTRCLMAPLSLTARYPECYRVTTDSRHDNRIAPGLPAREFTVSAPGKVRTTEITYIRTHQGGQYPATVTDLYSRRIAGRAMAGHMRTALCTEALQRAYWRRKPGRGLIQHSDRGSQYTGDDYRKRLAAMGMQTRHSGRGQCRDNAPTERFFRSLKDESPEYETL